jgi:nanoRNase/pAp phosphatase (c-di-AMP/oligoRNAs hydrolase)
MRYILVCADPTRWEFLQPPVLSATPPVYVVERPQLKSRIAQQGGVAVVGDLEGEAVYRRVFRSGHEPVLVAVPPSRHASVVAAIRRAAPAAPVLVLTDRRDTVPDVPGVTAIAPNLFAERVAGPELDRAATRARAEGLRRHFAAAERVLIMLQDDPDPDAIASALGLRALLGKNKLVAPIATFGAITRPENRAMARILDIDVEQIKPRAVEEYDMVAMVDVQPTFFEERAFSRVDLVIDHHPEEVPASATLKDIRPTYGATATIVTEYLRAADVKVSQRLATALLYGITADTQHLERGTTKADVEAFAFLHALANHRALRRIERPELPSEAIDLLGEAIHRRHVMHGVVFAHLDAAVYPELVAQFADLFLQIQGGEWAVVSGIVNGELHISVRNVGHVRAAGDVVRQAFGDLGTAGGHRAMAKAVVRLRDWRARVGEPSGEALRQVIESRFVRALRS